MVIIMKKCCFRMILVIMSLTLVILTISSCNSSGEKAVASVNGKTITQEQFDETCRFYRLQTEESKNLFYETGGRTESDMPPEIFEQKSDEEYLDIMIKSEYLASIDSDIPFEKAYNTIKESYDIACNSSNPDNTAAKYYASVNKILKEMNWSLEDYLSVSANILLADLRTNELKEQYAAQNNITDEQQLEKEFNDYLDSEIEKNSVIY